MGDNKENLKRVAREYYNDNISPLTFTRAVQSFLRRANEEETNWLMDIFLSSNVGMINQLLKALKADELKRIAYVIFNEELSDDSKEGE